MCSCSSWDHPRGCGAHFSSVAPSRTSAGSSPRVRGSLRGEVKEERVVGIIPAGAGLTGGESTRERTEGDHPRGCGAHNGQYIPDEEVPGSSPRVRGSRQSRSFYHLPIGIIPAGAGLTFSEPFTTASSRDHPRGCGAHSLKMPTRSQASGSSPRVRGSHFVTPEANTGRRDHPRGCGAHWNVRPLRSTSAGSSPRVRGSRVILRDKQTGKGIIPAGAGLTHRPSA